MIHHRPLELDYAGATVGTVFDDRQLQELHEVIEWSRAAGSRVGYFAALYTHVGKALDVALKNGTFDDPQRIGALNDVFFDRYVGALHAYRGGGAPTAVWAASFAATTNTRLCVLQHLMLGMNAHINFDLAIAVAKTVPPQALPGFRRDFDRMNALLASLVDKIAGDMAIVWPLLATINRLFRKPDDVIIDFSMQVAREMAWQHALRLSPLVGAELQRAIDELDAGATGLADALRHPVWPISMIAFVIRCGERGSVPDIIDDLLRQ